MAILGRNLIYICLIFFSVLCAPLSLSHAQDSLRLNEQKIKSGLIYNFIKATHWPEKKLNEKHGQINICLLGGDSFSGYLHPLQGKQRKNSPSIWKW